jgi:predicted TIM-barrel fold metal-dependent hydrolase
MAKHGFKVFDSDMHIMEPPDLWERFIAPEYRSMAPRGVTSENVRDLRLALPGLDYPNPKFSGKNYERNQKLYRDHAARGWLPEVQLEAMDLEGLDAAVMFPSRALNALTAPNMEPGYANAIARAYNDWLYEFCQTDPERMFGAGMISVYDIGHAVEETYRAVEELGFKAIFIRANVVSGKNWHDPYYTPLWNALEKLDIPLGLHEATGSDSHQVGELFSPNFGLRRIFSQPIEQQLAMGSFICGGVLARHPNLRVAFLEANCSWAPWLIWRMDESYELEGDDFMPDVEMMPSEYFKRQCIISVEPDETPVVHMIADFGNDNLVYSTDYPHGDSRYPKATESFLELPISDESKRKILWDNCARFYAIAERKGSLAV